MAYFHNILHVHYVVYNIESQWNPIVLATKSRDILFCCVLNNIVYLFQYFLDKFLHTVGVW